ncbi:MAG: transglycosylase, partial [Variovorax sp.]
MNKGLLWRLAGPAIVVALAAGCSFGPRTPTVPEVPGVGEPPSLGPLAGSLAHPKSRWVPVGWAELPGF